MWNQFAKRGLDVVLGALALLLVLPVLALAALAIKLVSRGSVLYRQEREGFGGETIRLLKLRSMIEGAEDELAAHLAADSASEDEWRTRFKLPHDPRIIPVVGTFLRRTSLDEAPQLWQVLKGELSLVGPRPFPEYHLREFPEDFRALRRQVRPGLTGLWQVMGRSESDLEDQQRYDTYYIRNRSLWMDLYILTRTLGAVLRRRGAV